MDIILRARRVWIVVRGEDASSFFASPQDRTDRTDTTTGGVMGDGYAGDVACSVIHQGLGEGLFLCVMAVQNDRRRMREFLHHRYNVNSTFSKAALHSTLARTRYTGQAMQEYVVQ